MSPPHSGPGLFVRATRQYPDYADEHLDWVSVCVLAKGKPRSRNPRWWEKRRASGMKLSAWDWFPDPDNPTKGLANAVQFAARQGCTSFILNAEKGFRKRRDSAVEYAKEARRLCDLYGLRLGFCSYSKPHTVRDLAWDVFAEHCDFGVPQIYDRENDFDPEYPLACIEAYEKIGFKVVLPACGIYYGVRPRHKGSRWKWRWRTRTMVERHLALFPRNVGAWVAWPLAGLPPEDTFRGLRRRRKGCICE